MTDRELMQMALEALETVVVDVKTTPNAYEALRQAITALRERLAQPYCDDCGGTDPECPLVQPEQKQWDAVPDAFNEWWNADYDDTGNPYRKDSPAYWAWSGWKAASKQPEQEPVAWHLYKDGKPYKLTYEKEYHGSFYTWEPLYATPQPRQWIGLTDAEHKQIQREHWPKDQPRAIEAKLKEKNT